jgi:hypothetical protein
VDRSWASPVNGASGDSDVGIRSCTLITHR